MRRFEGLGSVYSRKLHHRSRADVTQSEEDYIAHLTELL